MIISPADLFLFCSNYRHIKVTGCVGRYSVHSVKPVDTKRPFNIVSMVTCTLMGKMCCTPIVVHQSVDHKKIKDASLRNGDIDGTGKRSVYV